MAKFISRDVLCAWSSPKEMTRCDGWALVGKMGGTPRGDFSCQFTSEVIVVVPYVCS